MADAAEWFAGIWDQPPAIVVKAPEASDLVAGGPDVSVSDPLMLPWCVDGHAGMAGPALGESGAPLLCRGCADLVRLQCARLGQFPAVEDAALCNDFRPRAGVTVGRCWLWRIGLEGGRLVWWMALPEASQCRAVQWARQAHGDLVTCVRPVPGAKKISEIEGVY